MSIGIAGDTAADAASLWYAGTIGDRTIGTGDIAMCIIGGISLCAGTVGGEVGHQCVTHRMVHETGGRTVARAGLCSVTFRYYTR